MFGESNALFWDVNVAIDEWIQFPSLSTSSTRTLTKAWKTSTLHSRVKYSWCAAHFFVMVNAVAGYMNFISLSPFWIFIFLLFFSNFESNDLKVIFKLNKYKEYCTQKKIQRLKRVINSPIYRLRFYSHL